MTNQFFRRSSLMAGLVLTLFTAAGQFSPASAQTVQPTPQVTADPFAGLSIPDLSARTFGGGQIVRDQILTRAAKFTRYQFHYPSDGLTIYGFMDVPVAPPRNGTAYPVVIATHGYIDPKLYLGTWDYTEQYADDISAAGYIVLHPTLRNYGPSSKGPNILRVGYAIDVLNLAAIVRATGGQVGPLQMASPTLIGLWGHSMGGGVSIRAMTVDPLIKAVVLYAPISGDDKLNAQRWGMRPGQYDMVVPDSVYQQVSPINFYGRIQAAVSINQGLADVTVPPAWSADLCAKLQVLQKTVECNTYPGQGHIFTGASNQLLTQRTIAFFNAHLQ